MTAAPARRRLPAPASRRGRLIAAAAAAIALWLLVALAVAASARTPLLSAREELAAGADALTAGDAAAAAAAFARAEERAALAVRRLDGPLPASLAIVPGVGRQVAAVRAVADAAGPASLAARTMAEAVAALPDGVRSLAPRRGTIPLEPLRALAPAAAAADVALRDALQRAGAVSDRWLLAPVAAGRREALDELGKAAEAVGSAAALLDALPSFLGGDEPRRYFFGAVNPAELRGTGGFLGAYTILEVDEGALRFGPFGSVPDLPRVLPERIPPPTPEFAERYDRYSARGHMMNINMTPDFPSAAVAIQRLWAALEGEVLDGVVLADPFALQALMEVGGPVEIPGFGEVSADRVVAVVANEAYTTLTSAVDRKLLLGAVATGAVDGLLRDGGDDPAAVASALGGAVARGHLLFHAADAEVQAALARADVTGALEPGGAGTDVHAAIVNNTGLNKLDFYLEQQLRYRVALQPGGGADFSSALALRNTAPAEGDPYVIGPNIDGLDAGDNLMLLSLFLGPGSVVDEVTVGGQPEPTVEQRERGRLVRSLGVTVGSGEEEVVGIEGTTAGAWLPDVRGDRGTYRLVLEAQTAIRPLEAEIEVIAPPGMRVLRAGAPFTRVDDATVRATVVPDRRTVLEVEVGRGILGRARADLGALLGREIIRIGG